MDIRYGWVQALTGCHEGLARSVLGGFLLTWQPTWGPAALGLHLSAPHPEYQSPSFPVRPLESDSALAQTGSRDRVKSKARR